MSTWRPLGIPPSEREPRPVSEALDRVTRRLGGPSAGTANRVFSHWGSVVGADIAAHARPVSLRRGVLVLEVDHPAWATQLRFMASDLLGRLAEATGTQEVTAISLKVAGEAPEGARRGSQRGRAEGPRRRPEGP